MFYLYKNLIFLEIRNSMSSVSSSYYGDNAKITHK